jgi:hypothetical protein
MIDLSTALWILWALVVSTGFFVLEERGMRSGRDRWYTLTNRIRKLQAISPVARWAIYVIVVAFTTFLTVHFAVDPLLHPGP